MWITRQQQRLAHTLHKLQYGNIYLLGLFASIIFMWYAAMRNFRLQKQLIQHEIEIYCCTVC